MNRLEQIERELAMAETAMGKAIQRALDAGIMAMAFGDLFLEDVRCYREQQLAGTGLTPIFPIWALPTDALARDMVAAGLRARLTCVDPKQPPGHRAGGGADALHRHASCVES